MNKKTYILLGDPIALQRTRLSHNKVYDSQKNLKLVTGINLQRQHNSEPFFDGPLSLDVTFFMEIPKSRLRYVHSGAVHKFKPDLDNMIKYICDVCNKIVYNDDCTICKITATKVYDTKPRTEFTIEELK